VSLSVDRPYKCIPSTMEARRIKMTTNDIYYKGALVNLTAAGGVGIVASDTAAQGNPTLIATKQLDNTGKTEYLECETGVIFVPDTSAAQADVGDYAYATADDTIAKTATNADPCGKIVDVDVGVGWWVDLRLGIPKTALA
jgi:hypothetical protein